MASQYKTNVKWDPTLVSLQVIEDNSDTRNAGIAGLVQFAVKITTGAPTNTAKKFIGGAQIYNEVDSDTYENKGTTDSPDFQVVGGGGGGGDVLTQKVHVSSAQILSCSDTPVGLIMAPGAGKVIQPLGIILGLDWNSVNYISSNPVLIGNVSTQNGVVDIANFIDNQLSNLIQQQQLVVSLLAENEALSLFSSTNPTDGDSDIDIYITYKIITL